MKLKTIITLIPIHHFFEFLKCQMLFFGNLSQSMTDFVLRDLGLNRYENYDINPQNRPYKNEVEIKQHWLLFQLGLIFLMMVMVILVLQ